MEASPPTRTSLGIDVGLVTLTLIASRWVFLPATEIYAGPLSTLSALLVAILRAYLRSESWPRLRSTMGPARTMLASAGLFVAVLVLVLPPTLITERFVERADDTLRFGNLEGNLGALIWWITLSVAIGGFAEELVYRGFILARLVDALGGRSGAIVLGVLLQAAFFGFRHYYWQGLVGAVATGAAAVVFGVAFFLLKRNLWPLIIVHASINVIGLVEDYFGV